MHQGNLVFSQLMEILPLKQLIQAADDFWKPLIQFGFMTGVRMSELYGLKTDDIDMVSRKIYIRRSVSANLNYVYVDAPTKNVYSNRELDIDNNYLWKAIDVQLKQSKELQSEYFFWSREGYQLHASNFTNRVWKKLFEKCDVEYPHTVRQNKCGIRLQLLH